VPLKAKNSSLFRRSVNGEEKRFKINIDHRSSATFVPCPDIFLAFMKRLISGRGSLSSRPSDGSHSK